MWWSGLIQGASTAIAAFAIGLSVNTWQWWVFIVSINTAIIAGDEYANHSRSRRTEDS